MSDHLQFTAAQIAAAIGITPQAVRKALLDTPAAGARIVNGNEATTWSSANLPESLRDRLMSTAQKGRYRSIDELLSAPKEKWDPPIPREKISEEDIGYAKKLRTALRPWLLQQHDPELSSAEMESKGVADYRCCFGHAISCRYWRALFMRTLQRDGGRQDWNRLEIYLPKTPRENHAPARLVSETITEEFNELDGYIKICQERPSAREVNGIWDRAFSEHERIVASGTSPRKAARMLRDLLFAKVPTLAPSRDALLKAFDRKLAKWREKKPLDERINNGGDDFQFPQEDLDLIEFKIVFQYGKFAPAWREAWDIGQLSEVTRTRYRSRCKRKSYVPEKLIATLGKRPLWLYVLHRRRRDFKSLKAHFDTVYDGLHSLDCISADDVTLPVWFWHQPDPDQPPIITRGQCLVFIDLVSKRIIGWSLQPEKNYNAMVIFTQTARVFALKGVPRALLFEHGIWERSKMITGSAPHSIGEVTQGLKRFGIEFFHADSPEGKWEVEQVMGLIQNLMEGEPGYCGRDERRDRPDWIKRQLSEIWCTTNPNKEVHPSKHFYSFEQWNARLREIFEKYNLSPQGGKLMKDRSPDDIYDSNWNREDPPILLGPELRSLFARVKYETQVGPNGVAVTSGNRKFKYFGPELRDLVGYPVIVWFDPEFPDVAVITDMDEKSPIAVPLHGGVPRLERLTAPEGNALAEACARRDGQVSGIVARYNVLRDKYELPYRRNLVAMQSAFLGQEIEQKTQAVRSRKAEDTNRKSSLHRRASQHGVQILNDRQDDAERALQLSIEADREAEREAANRARPAAETEVDS